MKAKFDKHNLIEKDKKKELKRRYLEFLEIQAWEEKEQREWEQMTNQLSILRASEEGLTPRDLAVLQTMKDQMRKIYFGD